MKFISRKFTLTVTCALQVLMTNSLTAYFELDDIDKEAYSRHYSKLPSPEENNAKLKASSQFKPFLERAEEIVVRYGLESHVGLRLIHQHFPAEVGQIVTEEFQMVEETPSLVTWSHSFEEAKEKEALPASWIFTSPPKTPLMFEASTDPEVKLGSQMLQQNTEFMKEMSQRLYEYELNDLLAVSLLKRATLVGGEGQMYVERMNDNGKVSVLQLGYEKDQPENIIRTSWSFKGPKQHGCIMIQACQPLPWGGHLKVCFHQPT